MTKRVKTLHQVQMQAYSRPFVRRIHSQGNVGSVKPTRPDRALPSCPATATASAHSGVGCCGGRPSDYNGFLRSFEGTARKLGEDRVVVLKIGGCKSSAHSIFFSNDLAPKRLE